jgi:hypothetical protein
VLLEELRPPPNTQTVPGDPSVHHQPAHHPRSAAATGARPLEH